MAAIRHPLRRDDEYNEYVKDFYRKVEDYDWNEVTDRRRGLESVFHRVREKEVLRLVSRFGQGDRYLDVGCGTGLILRHLPAGSVGIDINPRHVERARRYVPGAEVRQGDVEQLNLPADSVTTAICTEVIEHVVHPDQVLTGIKKALKAGGILIGSTPRRALFWRFRFLSSTHYHNEPFHNEFKSEELLALFTGWEVVYFKTFFLGSSFFFVLRKERVDSHQPKR